MGGESTPRDYLLFQCPARFMVRSRRLCQRSGLPFRLRRGSFGRKHVPLAVGHHFDYAACDDNHTLVVRDIQGYVRCHDKARHGLKRNP